MPVTAKICGLSTPETLDAAIKHGASHVGFVFFEKSPRHVSFEQANELAARTPGHVKTVAVMVDPDDDFLHRMLSSTAIDILQLHKVDDPRRAKAIHDRCGKDLWIALPGNRHTIARALPYRDIADRILIDADPPKHVVLPGGTGLRFDWDLFTEHRPQFSWVLSGGLTVENVTNAIERTGADLVDVSSGVESSPGVKDVDKIAAFLQAVARL